MNYLNIPFNRKIISLLSLLCCCYFVSAQNLPIKLTVATYNVGHFNQGWTGGFQFTGDTKYTKEQRKTTIQKAMLPWKYWIGEQSLDILCIQEWNSFFDADSLFNAEETLLKPYYNNIYFGKEHTWIHNGIATNHQLSKLRTKYSFGEYYSLIGDMVIGDITITIISTHIPWQKDWHIPALNSLISDLKQFEYFICFGDMNATDDEQLLFVKAGFNMANGGAQGWFSTTGGNNTLVGRTGGTNMNIDNIITSKNIKIFNVSAPYTGLNDADHLPIIADVVITE